MVAKDRSNVRLSCWAQQEMVHVVCSCAILVACLRQLFDGHSRHAFLVPQMFAAKLSWQRSFSAEVGKIFGFESSRNSWVDGFIERLIETIRRPHSRNVAHKKYLTGFRILEWPRKDAEHMPCPMFSKNGWTINFERGRSLLLCNTIDAINGVLWFNRILDRKTRLVMVLCA